MVDDIVGDTELVRVLKLTAPVGDDDTEAVVCNIGCEVGGRCPDEFARVGRIARQALNGEDVFGWASKEFNGNGLGRSCSLQNGVSDVLSVGAGPVYLHPR